MDSILLIVIVSLDHWVSFLETGGRREVYELAIRSIDLVDFQTEDADPVDCLAAPDIAAEYDRITRTLTD